MTVILIMILVMIVLPIVFARLSGRNPMEVFFGSRVKGTAFDRKNDASAEEAGRKAGPAKKEKNSGKEDIILLISDLTSYARRNHYYMIMPGTLTFKGKTANLAAILITRGTLVGFNCFGFGGRILAGSGKDDWTQTMNGERRRFASPLVKNEEQEKILRSILQEEGLGHVESRVVGVFTAPEVKLSGTGGSSCYDRNSLKNYLSSDALLVSRNLNPEEIGRKLEPYVKRQKR
ncbi:MAG: NERD domain-containing protein [Lachnospiraceae bacterium]|nr:NERD domain-containing protein [Lachnospiraceae bacterium]